MDNTALSGATVSILPLMLCTGFKDVADIAVSEVDPGKTIEFVVGR